MQSRHLSLIGLMLAVLACNLGQPSSAPAATAAQPGIPIAATPIRLVIPSDLATGASAEDIDVVTDQTGAPWDVAPPHMQLTFQGYALQSTFHVAQLFLYPAHQYASMNPAAAESLKRLQTVLANPSAPYNKDTLPRAPFFNAAQVLAAQQKPIRFTGGAGVRFITQYAQDLSPINNGQLFYHFEGLTDDGKYYIIAVLPVNLPFLAVDNNPDSSPPAGGLPFPAPSNSPDAYRDYFQTVGQRIDSAPESQFNPTLDVLDALTQSITIAQ